MGLLILTALGALLGWLFAIVTQNEARDDVVCSCGAGVIGAVLAGALANSASIMQGVSGFALLLAVLGAAAFIVLAKAVRVRA